MKNLFIIGNGFDLHCKLETSYQNFYDETRKSNPTALREATEFYVGLRYEQNYKNENNLWPNFEEELANIDIDYLEDSFSALALDYNDENWSDSAHHDFQYEVERALKYNKNALYRLFEDWISNIDFASTSKHKVALDDCFFLTFNYTMLLEEKFSISKKIIKHIHGGIKNNNII